MKLLTRIISRYEHRPLDKLINKVEKGFIVAGMWEDVDRRIDLFIVTGVRESVRDETIDKRDK